MRNKLFSWVEHFLSRFTYTGKTRFICFLGFFYAFFLTFEIFLTQHELIEMFRLKSVGLTYHRELSRLLEDSLNLKLHLESKGRGGNESENERKHLAQDKVFSDNILDLMDQNIQIHSLKLGIEMPIFLLTEITLLQIPTLQKEMINIAIMPLQMKEGMQLTEPSLQYQDLIDELQGRINRMKAQIAHAAKEYDAAGNEKRASSMVAIFNEYEAIVLSYLENVKKAHQPFNYSQDFSKRVLEEGWKIQNSLFNFLEEDIKEALHKLYRRQRFSFLILFFGLLCFLAMYVTSIIRRPLEEIKRAAKALGDGNLFVRVPITSKDEVSVISQAFNEMAEAWEASLVKAKNITLRLVDTSASIFDIVKKFEANVANQNAIVESMKAQTKEIGVTTLKFKEVLKEVNKSIAVTSSFAEVGRRNLAEMEVITQQMKGASKLIVDTLASIGLQVENINGVLVTVVSIADQSNLLSINTAIRASQIGIKGGGFAVVAGKIRELADRTAFATIDVEETVQGIVKTVSAAFEDVEKFFSQILDLSDERMISKQLKIRIDQTQQQIKTFDIIHSDMDIQFKKLFQINALIKDLVQVSTETGKSASKLKRDADFLFQGTQDLHQIIKRFHFHQ